MRRSDPSQKAPMITYRATLDGPANWPSTWAGRCTPNAVCAARDWRARSHAEAGEAAVRTPDGARRRRIRIVRDYGMYDRRENPEYYPEVHRRWTPARRRPDDDQAPDAQESGSSPGWATGNSRAVMDCPRWRETATTWAAMSRTPPITTNSATALSRVRPRRRCVNG